MTKKDYIIIAQAIKTSLTGLSYASVNMGETNRCVETIAKNLCGYLLKDNNKFDTTRFLQACGVIEK
jgi:hypothetical protein